MRFFGFKKAAPARFAFLLGNAKYAHLTRLNNPPHDVRNVEEHLRAIGFEVERYDDLDCSNTWFRIEEFFARAGACECLVFYYCGHGVQVDGENYIVPVDFDPERPALLDSGRDFRKIDQLVGLGDVMRAMKGAATRFVFLDACRDDGGLRNARIDVLPSAPAAARAAPAAGTPGEVVTRSLMGNTGLAKPRLPERSETFICFATDPGDFAGDGKPGTMSPFSEAIASHIPVRGLDVLDMSLRVSRDVRAKTKDRQRPWANSSLQNPFCFNPADNTPIWVMSLLGGLTGMLGALLSFHLEDHIRLRNIAMTGNEWLYLVPLLFGSVLAFGAWRWGRRRWYVPLGTLAIYALAAAFSRRWFAPYAEKYSGNIKLRECLHDLRLVDFLWGQYTPECQPHMENLLAFLLIAVLAASIVGAASVFSAAPFARDMSSLPRASLGALIGAGGAALFLSFLWFKNSIAGTAGSWVTNLIGADAAGVLPAIGVVVLFMLWEAMLGANAGWAYAKPSNE